MWKTNFDQEVLAKPFNTTCSVNKKHNEGKTTRTVDANMSVSEMEQPEVEVSVLQNISDA